MVAYQIRWLQRRYGRAGRECESMTERSRLRAACYNRCRTSDTVRLVLSVVLVTGVVAGSLITLNRGRSSRIRGLGLSEFSVPVNRIWCTCSRNRYFRIAVRHPRRIDHRPTIETACGLHRSHSFTPVCCCRSPGTRWRPEWQATACAAQYLCFPVSGRPGFCRLWEAIPEEGALVK